MQLLVHCYSIDAVSYTGAYYGQGQSEIVLDNVDCVSSETNLNQCFRSTTHNCIHAQDASVACYPIRKPSPLVHCIYPSIICITMSITGGSDVLQY